MKKYNIGIAAFLMLLSGAMFFSASQLPAAESSIGPGSWPKLLSVVMFFLAVLLLLQGLLDHSGSEDPFDVHDPGFKRMLWGLGIIAVFCALLYFLGFMLASAFMIPAIMRLMDEKRLPVLAGVTVGVLAAIYVIFAVALHLPLPQGILF